MNWGWRIVVLYGGFVALILTLVIGSVQQEYHLVTENYYAEEIAYGDKMEKMANASALTAPLEILLDREKDLLRIKYPDNPSSLDGEIRLYRPSNAREDQAFEVLPDSNHEQAIDLDALARGMWRVQVEWSDGQKSYFKEQVLIL